MTLAARLISALLVPRTWLIAAALCCAAWLAVGYHQGQMHANIALGQPETVDPEVWSPVRKTLLGTALFMVVVGGVLALPVWQRFNAMGARRGSIQRNEPESSGAFQPIRTQEELTGEEKAGTAPRKSRVSRAASRFAQSILGYRETSKNQP